MKRLFIILVALSLTSSAHAQNEAPAKGYYMVIAAYNQTAEGYARRYSEAMSLKGHKAEYAYFPAKKMIFVYAKYYNDYGMAIADIATMREATATDAWVYINREGPESQSTQQSAVAVSTAENEAQDLKEPEEEIVPADSAKAQSEVMVSIPVSTKPKEAAVDNSKLIYFEALDAITQEPVDVNLAFNDPLSGNLIDEMHSGEVKKINPPANSEGTIQASVNDIGWIADAVNFNFDEPINDSTSYFLKQRGDTLVVLFDMHKMKKGDFQVLLNVYFIPDASLMKPISRTQINNLYDLMAANENMRIKLHGHTNGNSRGEYYRLAESDTIFFALHKGHEKAKGSAKQLSYDRANTIKRYLVYRGIAEERIEVEGWGGKKMLYDRLSRASSRNIRVEVEVLEE